MFPSNPLIPRPGGTTYEIRMLLILFLPTHVAKSQYKKKHQVMFPSNPWIPRPRGTTYGCYWYFSFRRMLESLSTKNASKIVNLAKFKLMAKNPVKIFQLAVVKTLKSARQMHLYFTEIPQIQGISLDRQELSPTTARSWPGYWWQPAGRINHHWKSRCQGICRLVLRQVKC